MAGTYKLTKIIKRDARTGEIVMIYPNLEVAAKAEGVMPETVRSWLYSNKKNK